MRELRSGLAAILGTFIGAGCGVAQTPWPTRGWTSGTPAEHGLDMRPILAIDSAIRQGVYGAIDHIFLVGGGRLLADYRYAQDYMQLSRGRTSPLGCGVDACRNAADLHDYNYLHPTFHPYYKGRPVHSLQSITKTVVSTLVGIAIARSEIDSVEVPLASFLAAYDLSRADPRFRSITLEDVLTMRSGIEWHELDRPIDETNTTLQLERSSDWVQFTLNQPMDADPGEKWAYNSGTSQVLSAVLRQATGLDADQFAERYLFEPLGITEYYWKRTPTGLPDTEGGLYLKAEDLAKIGYLFVRDGMWEGKQILPKDWVAAATDAHSPNVNPAGWGYGYQWWRLDRAGVRIWAGLGFGDQHLLVLPDRGLILVVHSWNLVGTPQRELLPDLITALIAATDEK